VRCIADVNVLLPIIADGHSHRTAALNWWDTCDDGDVGLCLPVHMARLRLLSNRRVMGSSLLAPEEAWNVMAQLVGDPWLYEIEPPQLKKLPMVLARVEAVRVHRAASRRAATTKLAATPTLFGEIRQPRTHYLGVPKTSSERLSFISIDFLPSTTIASTELLTVAGAALRIWCDEFHDAHGVGALRLRTLKA
jgi:predicted nucleic acid-binding protein